MDARKRLYPTDKEEREYRELKERYGVKDSAVAKDSKTRKMPVPKDRKAR